MRKIEKEMVSAFNARTDWEKDNTKVKTNVRRFDTKTRRWFVAPVVVYLWGNPISWIDAHGETVYDSAGWATRTTASRLNALGANVHIRGGVMRFVETGEEL